MQKCPGQDTRYWKPSDVAEVECAKCGALVEFFKTDGARRCPECGTRVVNPAVSMGCAQWCKHARECLGFDPATLEAARQQQDSLADKLIQAVKDRFGPDQRRIRHALRVLDHAEDILAREGEADPRVVVAAALLHDIGIIEAERLHGSSDARYQEEYGPPAAREILEGHRFRLALDGARLPHHRQPPHRPRHRHAGVPHHLGRRPAGQHRRGRRRAGRRVPQAPDPQGLQDGLRQAKGLRALRRRCHGCHGSVRVKARPRHTAATDHTDLHGLRHRDTPDRRLLCLDRVHP